MFQSFLAAFEITFTLRPARHSRRKLHRQLAWSSSHLAICRHAKLDAWAVHITATLQCSVGFPKTCSQLPVTRMPLRLNTRLEELGTLVKAAYAADARRTLAVVSACGYLFVKNEYSAVLRLLRLDFRSAPACSARGIC